MEYNDLMQQAEDFNKKLHRTKDINVCDLFTAQDKVTIAKIVDTRVKDEYGDMHQFVWTWECKGHFVC